ncbi:abortive infection protein [Fibrisoma limi BUZ 3]|uniref:Abortive infection protein n=1 Tax=Fibrisoma limi BUZ 3 TaxID=1185876 RepID=I2GIU8_9BACT|nr:type II CAAX endopeptidase family protein [Fibrisoma limi]CCH53823.1 abortive infection protein [Fibrisoma limi BUZ 3]
MQSGFSTSQRFWFPILHYFGWAYAISWLIWAPYYMDLGVSRNDLPYVHLLGSLGPLLASVAMTLYQRGRPGIRQFWGRATGWLAVRWLAIGAFSPVVVLLGVISSIFLTHQQVPHWPTMPGSGEFASFSPWAFVLANLLFFGFGEEVGWRGYVLPRLQVRYSAFTSNLILTAFWAIWHWPLFFNPLGGYAHMDLGAVIGWVVSLVTGGILFTWLFNTSRGNVVACALFHGSMDLVFTADLGQPVVSSYTGILVTLWGIAIWFFYGRATLSPSGKVTLPSPEQPVAAEA